MPPSGPAKLVRRERAIEAARRRLKRLEIETHRIKAALARLEADYEDDLADWLTRALRCDPASHNGADDRAPEPVTKPASAVERSLPANRDSPKPPAGPRPNGTPVRPHVPRLPLVAKANATVARRRAPADEPPPPIVADVEPSTAPGASPAPRRAARRRSSARPLVLSFGVHAAALLLCTWLTFTTLVDRGVELFASPPLAADDPERLGEIEITAHKFTDDELQNLAIDDSTFNVADHLLREFDPSHIGAGSEPLGDMGQLDAPIGDLGKLMAGAGDPASGPNSGPTGEAVFFGAQSRGNRFVYVVDNSSSMKDGRLETAVAELRKSVEGLTPRQFFYVIFVSDQPYPMFFPAAERDLLPATSANKKRLAEWVPKAILAPGKNREWIKAMDLAASLRPHAVFLLWDGDMRTSDKVRLDVTAHLTRPNQWQFAIHTIGLGVTSLDAEYTLTAIAQAHGGTYRRIEMPNAPRR